MLNFRLDQANFGGLRFRIGSIFLLGLLPAILMLAWQIFELYLAENSLAADRAKAIAAEIADRHSATLKFTELALARLKDSQDVRAGALPQCQTIFRGVVERNRWLTSAWATDFSGRTTCTNEGPPRFNRSDRPDFINAIQTGEFSVGQYRIGAATGRTVVPVSMPFYDANGAIAGTLGTAIDMSWIASAQSNLVKPTSAMITIFDDEGMILFSSESPERFVGKFLKNSPFAGDGLDGGRSASLDGVERIFSSVALDNPNITIRVGVRESDVLTAAFSNSQNLVLVLIFSALIGGITIFWGLGRFVTRPVQLLAQAAANIATGKLVGVPAIAQETPGEIGALAREISTMAENIQQREAFLRSVTDNVPVSISYIDSDGIFRFVNRTAEHWLAASSLEIIGSNFERNVANPGAIVQSSIAQALSGEISNFEQQIMFRDGVSRWVDITRIPDIDGDGRVRGYFRLMIDITRRKEADRAKDEFISTMNHELRTPLTSIKGSLSLLASGVGGSLAPRAGELIKIAHDNSDRLIGLINDILDAQKIASGMMDYSFNPLELGPFLVEAIEANKGFGDIYQVNFVIGEMVSSAWVNGDRARLMQVMANLLSNAAKFSPPNEQVEITLKGRNGFYRVAVHDMGPGIPPAFRNRIFERFSQADGTDQRHRGGTGLGLSICRSIVEAHRGVIGFECDAGRGTTFYVDLPVLSEAAGIDNGEAIPRPNASN